MTRVFLACMFAASVAALSAADAVQVDGNGILRVQGNAPASVGAAEVAVGGGDIRAGGDLSAESVSVAGALTAGTATVAGQPVVLDNDPRLAASVPILSAWTSFTPLITAQPTNPTYATGSPKCFWRRVGDCMEIRFFLKSSAGTAGSGKYHFHLPSGYTIDGTKCEIGANVALANAASTLGVAQARMYGINGGIGTLFPMTTTTLGMMVAPGASTGYDVVGSNFFPASYAIAYSFTAMVPIAEWAE